MKSLITEVIPQRLGPTDSDFPDAQYQNEASGVLPTPVIKEFMTSYHYSFLRMLQEAGIAINGNIDNITNNQFWDAYLANTKGLIFADDGRSLITPLIISGQTRALSSLPYFLSADGAALEFTLLATAVNLLLSINGVAVPIVADIVETGLTAAPSTNNTADINDANISNDLYAGEIDADINEIAIDNVGSEITSRVGQIVAFKTPTGEIFRGLLKTASLITNVFRGYYFDDSDDPIPRQILSNDDTITLMELGHVFAINDGTTLDVSYTTPIESFSAPSAPSVGDYWFDTIIQKWKVWTGTWDIANAALVGEIISDATNTIASRPADFSNNFKELNSVELEIFSTEVIKSRNLESSISVYGVVVNSNLTKLVWDITSDLESPQIEASSTLYYPYVSDQSENILSNIKPYYRADLKGWYHPYQSWRNAGKSYNDSGSDLKSSEAVSPKNQTPHYYQQKYLNGIVASGAVAALTFSDLIIGNWYRITTQVWAPGGAATGAGALESQQGGLTIMGTNTTLTHGLQNCASRPFKATADTLTHTFTSLSAGNLSGDGTDDKTWAILEGLNWSQ